MKMKTTLLAALPFVIAIAVGVPAHAEEGLYDVFRMNRETNSGNGLYHEGKYEAARASYMRAKDMGGEESEHGHRLHLNMGDTFYKEGNYEQAEKELQKALGADDPSVREMAYYNLGNTQFKKAGKSEKLEDLEKAVEYYQKALEINPDDQDAKFNIEVVRRHIDLKMQEQQQSPSCPNPKQQQGGQQNQDQQGKQEQQDQNQQQQDQQQEGQSKPEPESGSTASDQQKQEQTMKPTGSAEQQEKLSEEDAKRLLNAIQQNEQEDLKKWIDSQRQGPRSGGRDW